MPKSKRRHETSFNRQNNPSQSFRNRSGGFEETGSGYRPDDQERRFGYPSQPERYGERRQDYGRQEYEGWREPRERTTYSEGRDWPDYERESRFNLGYERSDWGRRDWSQNYPESYRAPGREDWEQGRRERDYWRRADELEGEYGYEPGDYSERGGAYDWSQSGQSSREGSRPSWSENISRGSFGQQGRSHQGRFLSRYQQSSFGQTRPATSQGSFAGRGPQGYTRSDERIKEDVSEALTQDHEIDASNMTVEVQNGEVTLKGSVHDREAKRRAEDIAESCSGVREVQNQLRVRREDETESESRREKTDEKQKTSHRQQIAS